MPRHYSIELANKVLTITITRSRSGNMVSSPMMRALSEAIAKVEPDGKVQAVLLQSHGRDFCLGRDTAPPKGGPPVTAMARHDHVMGAILGTYSAFWRCPVPVIARVQGRAIGFGCGMIGASDIAICEESSRFALPEMRGGIPPTLVITALQHVNRKAIAELVYSCREIGAQEALAMGMVSRVVPDGELDGAVGELLNDIRGYHPLQVQHIKRFLDKPGQMSPEALSDLAGFQLATVSTGIR